MHVFLMQFACNMVDLHTWNTCVMLQCPCIVAAFTRYSFKHTNFILELLQLVQGNKWTDVKYNEV